MKLIKTMHFFSDGFRRKHLTALSRKPYIGRFCPVLKERTLGGEVFLLILLKKKLEDILPKEKKKSAGVFYMKI